MRTLIRNYLNSKIQFLVILLATFFCISGYAATPILSAGAPSGVLLNTVTQATLSLTTNEAANCKYSDTPDTTFAVMGGIFVESNSTSHTKEILNVVAGNSYIYYVRCEDILGNANTSDYLISFSLAEPDIAVHTVLQSPTPIIDGNLSEYSGANLITFAPITGNNTVSIKTLWNSSGIYFGIQVTDDELIGTETVRDGTNWKEDSIEWFIDTANDRGGDGDLNATHMDQDDYQGIVNTVNGLYDATGSASGTADPSWNGAWDSAVVIDSLNNNYTIEIKVPWTSIGYTQAPQNDTFIGLSFAINDKDTAQTSTKMWLSTALANQNASNWQEVKLSGASVPDSSISPTMKKAEFLD